MSNFIDNNLQKDEQVIAKAEFSYLCTVPWILFEIIFTVFILIIYASIKAVDENVNMIWYPILMCIIGIIPFVFSILEVKATELAITNRRIIGKRGIFSLKTTEILINKIDTVKVQATFLGRVFNYYTIEFAGSGKGTDQVIMMKNNLFVIKDNVFKGVKNANEIKNVVSVAIEKYADEARKAQAADIAESLNDK